MKEEKIEKLMDTDNSSSNKKVPDKFLPIGTIVTLKGAEKSLMIIGYCPVTNNEELFDYCAVLVPEGLLSSSNFLVFNHDSINEVNFMGLKNNDFKNWIKVVEKSIDGAMKKETN